MWCEYCKLKKTVCLAFIRTVSPYIGHTVYTTVHVQFKVLSFPSLDAFSCTYCKFSNLLGNKCKIKQEAILFFLMLCPLPNEGDM